MPDAVDTRPEKNTAIVRFPGESLRVQEGGYDVG